MGLAGIAGHSPVTYEAAAATLTGTKAGWYMIPDSAFALGSRPSSGRKWPNVFASRDRAGPHREEIAIAPHAARPVSWPAPVSPGTGARWFSGVASEPDSRCLIFCLPYSGAGAGAFDRWRRSFPAWLELAAVRLPGREQRLAESPDLRPDIIAEAIAARADRPYAIFGHSVGATVGFEVIRALRRLGGSRLPLRLYAAAAMPPGVPDPVAGAGDLGPDECEAALTRLIGAGAHLPDDPELRELVFPALRGDLRWLHRYACRPSRPCRFLSWRWPGRRTRCTGRLSSSGGPLTPARHSSFEPCRVIISFRRPARLRSPA